MTSIEGWDQASIFQSHFSGGIGKRSVVPVYCSWLKKHVSGVSLIKDPLHSIEYTFAEAQKTISALKAKYSFKGTIDSFQVGKDSFRIIILPNIEKPLTLEEETKAKSEGIPLATLQMVEKYLLKNPSSLPLREVYSYYFPPESYNPINKTYQMVTNYFKTMRPTRFTSCQAIEISSDMIQSLADKIIIEPA